MGEPQDTGDPALEVALEGVSSGSGRVVVVTGPRGSGRTRWALAAERRAHRAGLRALAVHTGAGLGVPFEAVSDLLGELAEGPGAAERFAGEAACTRALLTGRAAAHAPEEHDRTIRALHLVVRRTASERPLALVVDDLDAADEASARCLEHIAARAARLPLLLVVTLTLRARGRAGELRARLSALPTARVVELGPLGRGDLDAMVAERGLPALDDESSARMLEDTAGDAALLAAVLDAGGAPLGTGSDAAVAAAARVAGDRLRGLGPAAAAILDAVVVLGEDASPPRAARVAGAGAAEAAEALDRLAGAGLLVAGDRPRPACPLLEAALSPVSARRIRRRAAALVRDEGVPLRRVAQHVHSADPGTVPGAVEMLAAAAAQDLEAGRVEAAERHLRRAVAEPEAGADERRRLVAVQAALGRDGAAERFEAVLRADAPHHEAAARALLADALLASGRRRPAAQALRRAMDALGDDVAAAGRRADLEAAFVAVARDLPGLAADAREILAERARTGPLRGTLAVTAAVDGAYYGLPRERVGALASDALDAVLRGGTAPDQAARCVSVLVWCDELDAARDAAVRLRANAAAPPEALAAAEAWVHLLTGRLPDAAAAARASAAAAQARGAAPDTAALAVRAVTALEAGDLDGAAAALAAAGLCSREERGPDVHLLDAQGRLELMRGDVDAAVASFARAVELGRSAAMHNPAVVRAWFGLAWALRRLGRTAEARERAAEALRRAEAFGAPRAVAAGLQVTAACAPDPEEAAARLERALALLGPTPAALERTRALVAYGAALCRAGRRAEGRARLREALDAAHGMGAAVLERDAREALRAAGARPRRARLTGVAALTPAERQVADHAGRGLSNRQIAEALFVTPKTVEWHLRNVYSKLGIGDRRQLVGALREGARRDRP